MVTIKIEIDAGTHINQAFQQAIRIASILHVRVEFHRNGVKCFATENGDADQGEANWYAEFLKDESNGVAKMAFAD